MFDIAPSEFLLVAFVALVVIGPKDLPKAMRVVGYWVGKARGVARQFRSGFDSMVREAELEEMEKRWASENERIMREHPQTDPAKVDGEATEAPHDGAMAADLPATTDDTPATAVTPTQDAAAPMDHSSEPVMVEKPVVVPAKPMHSLDLFDGEHGDNPPRTAPDIEDQRYSRVEDENSAKTSGVAPS
jgi:sec-independent protein translocase protein TatB